MSRLLAVSAALAVLLAAPASAASGITSPGDGEVVTAEAVVPLRAEAEGPSDLSLLAPGASTAEVVAVTTEPGELAHDLDTSCATTACTPAANGTWTLRLSGAAEDERTFVLRIPPVTPLGTSAARSETGVRVRWQQGDEPDLRGYRVEDAEGRVVRDGIGLDACDAERFCSADVPEAGGAWSVRAFRRTCPDCADLLASAPSEVVRAEDVPDVEAAAVPTSAPSSAPPAAVRAPDQGAAFAGAFGSGRVAVPAPAPPQGRAVLPALPQAGGSYDSELGYAEREVVVAEPRAPLSRAQEAVGEVLWTGERLRLLALSGLMVAGSLWLRRWARRYASE